MKLMVIYLFLMDLDVLEHSNNLYFYESVISKDYLFDGIVHLNKNTHTTKRQTWTL